MPNTKPPFWLGVVAAAAAVALTTLLVYPLKPIAADISLSVVYLLAVLFVASLWGGWLAIATAFASALAFNFFHIPPTGRLTIDDGENWVALVVFLITAIVASALADAARSRALEADQRRREADLAAEMSRTLLRGESLRSALSVAAERLSAALDLPSAAIELGPVQADERRLAFPLREGTRQIGTLAAPGRHAGARRSVASRSASSRRSRRCSRRRSNATRCSTTPSRRARCAAATCSRRRCCAPSATTCARR